MAKNIVFERELFHVNPDGQSDRKVVKLHMDGADAQFHVVLPKHVGERQDPPTLVINGDSLQQVIHGYESAMEQYQRWRLKAKASPMIMLVKQSFTESPVEGTHTFASFAFFAEHVYVSEPQQDGGRDVYLRTGTTDNVLDFGDMGPKIKVNENVIAFFPDNREVRAKVKQLADSVNTAGAILNSIKDAPDDQKLTAFLNIGEAPAESKREAPANPAQQTLPLDDPDEVL